MSSWSRGFTLIEILVVVSIISIMTGTVVFFASQSSATGRDADRQADLRALQAAVEAYKRDNGQYPAGCRGDNNWSGEAGTAFACTGGNEYIQGLAPRYIRRLPTDPNRNACSDTVAPLDCGYAYITNATRDVYKIIAMNTVEGPPVTAAHPMKSCDYITTSNNVREAGWCGVQSSGSSISSTDICHPGHPRFQESFAVWGGIARIQTFDFNSNAACFPATGARRCLNPFPQQNPTIDMFDQFVTIAGVYSTTTVSASNANRIRVGAVGGTTAIICR